MPASMGNDALVSHDTTLDIDPPVSLRFVNPLIQIRYAPLACSGAPETPPPPMRNLSWMYPNPLIRNAAQGFKGPC